MDAGGFSIFDNTNSHVHADPYLASGVVDATSRFFRKLQMDHILSITASHPLRGVVELCVATAPGLVDKLGTAWDLRRAIADKFHGALWKVDTAIRVLQVVPSTEGSEAGFQTARAALADTVRDCSAFHFRFRRRSIPAASMQNTVAWRAGCMRRRRSITAAFTESTAHHDILDETLQSFTVYFHRHGISASRKFSVDSSLLADSGAGGDLRASRVSAQPSTTRGRPRELNPRRTAAHRGYGRAPVAPAPPPAPTDGSVASETPCGS
jgi:hypothetical protein